MECRFAELKDVHEVTGLWCDLIRFYGDDFSHYGGQLDLHLLERSFFHMVKDDSFLILVVEHKGLVGTCTLHLNRFSSWSGTYYGTLEDLIVHQDWRGQGIGRLLIKRALEEAKGAGLSRVELHVLEDNQVAQALYEKEGLLYQQSLVYGILFSG